MMAFLRGHGGTHKSRMVLQGGMCAQAGHPFFGSQPVPGLTFVHVAGEDMADEVIRRVHRIRDGFELGDRADQAATLMPATSGSRFSWWMTPARRANHPHGLRQVVDP